MSSALEVGEKLVAFCRDGKFLDAVNTLYGPNIVSIEPHGDATMPARTEGLGAVRAKTEWWLANHISHGTRVEGPWPHGDRFIVVLHIDVTAKTGRMAGQRTTFDEACLYTVKNGKIIHEEFFYDMPA